ncbi:unnamed protein product [Rotaria sordida]|uniref:Uncharacterized protein n=1 Tax=Rotaria sordida TaxID=392033 RepID=A0A819LSJ3_9BILA|nr:unnamed protein product [Rotaria sordida]
MKFFNAFLLIFFSFAGGKIVLLDDTVASTNIVGDSPPPAYNVTINVIWAFSIGINITNVVMTINNLKSSEYAAMGLGQNQSMGEAHVFMCKRFANDTIAIQRYVNPKDHHHPVPAGSEQGGVFTPLPSKFTDVEQPNKLRPLSQSGKYHPIFAVGLVNSTGDPQYHDGREPQSALVQLNQNQNLIFHQNSSKLFNEINPSS